MNILGMQLVVSLHRNVFPSTEMEHMHSIFIAKIMVWIGSLPHKH